MTVILAVIGVFDIRNPRSVYDEEKVILSSYHVPSFRTCGKSLTTKSYSSYYCKSKGLIVYKAWRLSKSSLLLLLCMPNAWSEAAGFISASVALQLVVFASVDVSCWQHPGESQPQQHPGKHEWNDDVFFPVRESFHHTSLGSTSNFSPFSRMCSFLTSLFMGLRIS